MGGGLKLERSPDVFNAGGIGAWSMSSFQFADLLTLNLLVHPNHLVSSDLSNPVFVGIRNLENYFLALIPA